MHPGRLFLLQRSGLIPRRSRSYVIPAKAGIQLNKHHIGSQVKSGMTTDTPPACGVGVYFFLLGFFKQFDFFFLIKFRVRLQLFKHGFGFCLVLFSTKVNEKLCKVNRPCRPYPEKFCPLIFP